MAEKIDKGLGVLLWVERDAWMGWVPVNDRSLSNNIAKLNIECYEIARKMTVPRSTETNSIKSMEGDTTTSGTRDFNSLIRSSPATPRLSVRFCKGFPPSCLRCIHRINLQTNFFPNFLLPGSFTVQSRTNFFSDGKIFGTIFSKNCQASSPRRSSKDKINVSQLGKNVEYVVDLIYLHTLGTADC